MEFFSVSKRKYAYKQFMKKLNKLHQETQEKNNQVNYKYESVFDMFRTKYLSMGEEGIIYKSQFRDESKEFTDFIVLKQLILQNLRDKKNLADKLINSEPDQLYNLFLSKKAFTQPSLTEIISNTLTNQLVFQNICPHFVVNYYWDYQDKVISIYNEYVNYKDFDTWAQKNHRREVWYNALFQIMIAIIALQKHFGMIHSDLHTQNILVQKVKRGGYWKYTLDNHTYYLPNLGFVFLIHDFGFSWIPRKLTPVKWHYNDTLKHLTPIERKFYDISIFLKWLNDKNSNYKLPGDIQSKIKEIFPKKERDLNVTMESKFGEMFNCMYSTKPKGELVETYSLDKSLNYTKLPNNFKKLVIS